MSKLPEWLPREFYRPAGEAQHEALRFAQRILRVEPTGDMDAATITSLRGFQRLWKLPPTGSLDKATAWKIDSLRWG